MATSKQMEYIKKLNVWKAANLDMDRVGKMSEEQASALIDDLKSRKSVRQDKSIAAYTAPAPQEVKVSQKIDTWNPVQSGMMKKGLQAAYLEQHNVLAVPDEKTMQELVAVGLAWYELFNRIDDAIKQKYPEVAR